MPGLGVEADLPIYYDYATAGIIAAITLGLSGGIFLTVRNSSQALED